MGWKALGFDSYDEYLRSDHWIAFRRTFKADPTMNACRVCGRKMPQYHHINYECLGAETADDVVPLCGPHHKRIHKIIERTGRTLADTSDIVAEMKKSLDEKRGRNQNGNLEDTSDAFDAATDAEWTIEPEIAVNRPKRYQLFIKFCAHLQFNVGDVPIYLPTRKIGSLLSVTPITISRYCEWAVTDAYIVKVAESEFHPHSKGKSKAASYSFDLSRFSKVFSQTRRK